jgi:hypothetical protein
MTHFVCLQLSQSFHSLGRREAEGQHQPLVPREAIFPSAAVMVKCFVNASFLVTKICLKSILMTHFVCLQPSQSMQSLRQGAAGAHQPPFPREVIFPSAKVMVQVQCFVIFSFLVTDIC